MEERFWEIAVIGAGPGGLFAAVVAGRRQKEVVLIGKELHSTRLIEAEKIENFPGLPLLSGRELSDRLWGQLDKEKVSHLTDEVQIIGQAVNGYQLFTRNRTVSAKAVILATGVKLHGELPGEKEMAGRGVSYCANCDALFFKGKTVAVIGYTREGEEEANYLADVCGKVYFLPLYKKKPERLKSNVEILKGRPVRISGGDRVEALETDQGRINVEGVFIAREALPPGELLPGLAVEDGFIKVDRNQATNLPGIFAAGDCVGKPWQIAKTLGEAQVAALSAARYLDELNIT